MVQKIENKLDEIDYIIADTNLSITEKQSLSNNIRDFIYEQ